MNGKNTERVQIILVILLKYFTKTIDLANDYNPMDQLKAKGIQPGEKVYKVSQVVEAIPAKWKVKPQIACYAVTDRKTRKRIHLLWEIRFCPNKNEGKKPFGLRDCEKTVDVCNSCTSENFDTRFPIRPFSTSEITRESGLEYIDEL
ncbi:hypothetical protein PTKIN_Ptkin16aG0034300 [Pterospermum kingtungense]